MVRRYLPAKEGGLQLVQALAGTDVNAEDGPGSTVLKLALE